MASAENAVRRDGASAGVHGRILIVDDEDAILFSMKEYFTGRGFAVDCAQEMEEAEALVANVQYDAAIVDLRLTGTNGIEGLEIVEYIKERCPRTGIVLLTAYGSPEIETEARIRGIDAFLQKPMPLSSVERIVYEVIGRQP
ncbi:MAG TPA: response regulator [Blastocatellia bacterium]|nr:response regulator [Blastocatellia bacterium]